MEELLLEIKAAILKLQKDVEYQGKLLEEIYQVYDTSRHQASQHRNESMKQVRAAMDIALSNPMLKGNPHLRQSVEDMISVLAGGKQDGS